MDNKLAEWRQSKATAVTSAANASSSADSTTTTINGGDGGSGSANGLGAVHSLSQHGHGLGARSSHADEEGGNGAVVGRGGNGSGPMDSSELTSGSNLSVKTTGKGTDDTSAVSDVAGDDNEFGETGDGSTDDAADEANVGVTTAAAINVPMAMAVPIATGVLRSNLQY